MDTVLFSLYAAFGAGVALTLAVVLIPFWKIADENARMKVELRKGKAEIDRRQEEEL